MTAGTVLNPGSGGDTIFTDDPGAGTKYAASKLLTGAAGVAGALVAAANPLPIRQCDGTGFVTPVVGGQIPASLGQKTMAASLAVVIASDQGPLPATAAQGAPNTAANRWPVTVSDGTNAAAVKAASTAAVATDPAVVVAVSPNNVLTVQEPSSTTASAPSRLVVGTTSLSILFSNANRKRALVVNCGTTTIYLGLGQTPTALAYHVPLAPCANSNDDGSGGTYMVDIWDGAINAISNAAGGAVCVTEMT